MAILSNEELKSALLELPNWEYREGVLYKKFVFANFIEAFGFMSQVAFYAEKLNHHPDWKNSYSRVEVELTTHEQGGVTEKDIELAKKMEEIYPRFRK